MIVKVGVPTMTYFDLRQVLHDLLDTDDADGELDSVEFRIRVDGHLAMLRTITVEENSDFTDGRERRRVIVLSSELPY